MTKVYNEERSAFEVVINKYGTKAGSTHHYFGSDQDGA